MAFFLDGIANFFDHFFGSVDSEDDYLDPPTSGGKRKAREELRRPSQSYKARRYSTPHFYAKFSAYDSDSSEDSDFSDGPQYLARGVHSETETDHSSTYEEYNPDHFLKHRNSLEKNRARAQSLRHQSSARRDSVHDSSPANRRRSSSSPRAVSRERVRKERLNFFDGLANIAKGVVSTIVGTEADEPKLIDDDIQKQLRDEYLVESEDSDAQLSEGALGRKYWSSTPLKPQRSKVARQTPVPPASVKVRPSAPGRSKDVKLPVDVPTHKSPGPTQKMYTAKVNTQKQPTKQPGATKPPVSPAKTTINPNRMHIPAPTNKLRTEVPSYGPASQGYVRPHFKEWSTDPSKRTKEVMGKYPNKYPQKIIEEIQEPGYAIRDVEIRDMFWQIMDMTEKLAKKFFGKPSNEKPLPAGQMKIHLKEMYKLFHPTTAQIIGCIATGGPRGEEGWDDLFTDPQKHRALVCGIIGNVLVEQVFKHPCFGAEDSTIEELISSQTALKDDDGFVRKSSQATILQALLFPDGSTSLQPPKNFTAHTEAIVHALLTHLLPIYTLSPSRHELRDTILLSGNKLHNARAILERHKVVGSGTHLDGLFENLTTLITMAGLLALHMVSDPHTVYHHVPVFKEDRFDHDKHEAFNHRRMELTHPRQETTKWPAGTTKAEKDRAQGDEALNQILLMDGLTAYRRGGWEDWATSRPHWDESSGKWTGRVYVRSEDKDDGFRGRILTPGWVCCRWGRARRFGKNGEAMDRKEDHGAANWVEPGFVEFSEVLENAKKERVRKSMKSKGKEPKRGDARFTY